MPRRALLSLVAALALAGCAPPAQDEQAETPAFRGEDARVANTVAAFQSAAEDEAEDLGGSVAVCRRLLTPELVARLDQRGGCRREVAAALADADPGSLAVREVAVRGERATATARATTVGRVTRDERYELVRRDGTWRLAGIAG